MEPNIIQIDHNYRNHETEWQQLSLTLVEYPKGDVLGKFLAFMSLSPFGIGAGFLALILFRRDLHTVTFFIGILVNEATNYVLKHIICEERPMRREASYTEYGMPSSHSQYVWFFTSYVVYFVFIRLHHMNNNSIMSAVWRVIVVGGCLTLSLIVSVSRTYLKYHTSSQVIVGGILGFVMATLWFAFTQRVLTPLFPQIVSWKISEFLMLRDTTLIPNVLWFEYTTSRQEARARSRKLAALKPQQ